MFEWLMTFFCAISGVGARGVVARGGGVAGAGRTAAPGAPGAAEAPAPPNVISRPPSFVQNFASSGYTVPHVGHRMLIGTPCSARPPSRGPAPPRRGQTETR